MGVLLASYSWSGNAKRFGNMNDHDVIQECLGYVAELHGMNLTEVRAKFVEGHVKRWGSDPYALGAYALAFPHHVST